MEKHLKEDCHLYKLLNVPWPLCYIITHNTENCGGILKNLARGKGTKSPFTLTTEYTINYEWRMTYVIKYQPVKNVLSMFSFIFYRFYKIR